MKALRRVAWMAAVLCPTQALAASVFLNGVKVDGILTDAKIEKCSVEFDAMANVLLTCPGYSIHVETAAPSNPVVKEKEKNDRAQPKLDKRYFLVTEQPKVGATDYDIDVLINSKLVRRILSSEEQIISEVTQSLQPGKNVVTFVARKRLGGERKSTSPESFFRVVIGTGISSGDKVTIDNALAYFQKSAADTTDATQDFTIEAQ